MKIGCLGKREGKEVLGTQICHFPLDRSHTRIVKQSSQSSFTVIKYQIPQELKE